VGRQAISRMDAKRLLAERRESEARAREAARVAAEAQDGWHRAHQVVPRGLPWDTVPEGADPVQWMIQSDHANRPKRQRAGWSMRLMMVDHLSSDHR
jgi:hypothetical protein